MILDKPVHEHLKELEDWNKKLPIQRIYGVKDIDEIRENYSLGKRCYIITEEYCLFKDENDNEYCLFKTNKLLDKRDFSESKMIQEFDKIKSRMKRHYNVAHIIKKKIQERKTRDKNRKKAMKNPIDDFMSYGRLQVDAYFNQPLDNILHNFINHWYKLSEYDGILSKIKIEKYIVNFKKINKIDFIYLENNVVSNCQKLLRKFKKQIDKDGGIGKGDFSDTSSKELLISSLQDRNKKY